jgi:hypothetical protein
MPSLSFLRLPQGYSLMADFGPGLPAVGQLVQAVLGDGPGAGLRALYPEEPGGGARLGVNEAGAAFALLSLSDDQRLTTLVPAALGSASAGGGLERAALAGLAGLPPFVLVGVEAAHAPLSLAWDGAALQRRLHPDAAMVWALGPDAELRRQAFDAMAAALNDDPAAALAAQEGQHLADGWGRHVQVLLLPARILLRYHEAEAAARGGEAQAAWLART